MAVINKLILWLGRIGLGLFVIGLILIWLDLQTEKRITAARLEGKAQCEADYNQKTIQNNSEIAAKTQEILKYKNLLKEQRKGLSDDCKAIYDIDLSSCRQQLRDKAGS